MTELQQLLHQIQPADAAMYRAAQRHWDGLAKPLGSLGRLEEAVCRMAAITGKAEVRLQDRALLVFCADNGVVCQGVTQCDSSVTAAVATALAENRSTVNYMANTANCRVLPVDMGILDYPGHHGVKNCRIRNATADSTQGPAMTRQQCEAAILAGARLAMEQKADILIAGEMGIGNTTTSSSVAAVLLNQPVSALTGRGAGLSDAGLARKKQAVQTALAVNVPAANDPVDVLTKVGGLDIAGMCGAFLGAAAARKPILVDGVISSVAALCAARLCPAARDAMLASHRSAEPAGGLLLQELGLNPLLDAEMRLGEGSGGIAALPLLDMALAVYHSGNTFHHLGIEAYTPQS